MATINVDIPGLNYSEGKQVEDWLKGLTRTKWQILKDNFSLFCDSLWEVCKDFWGKISGFCSNLWHAIFG